MASKVKHAFTSAKSDGGDATLVRPSNWNADHTGALEVLDSNLTQVDVVSTLTETSLYSFAIPAGVMGSDGGFQVIMSGTLLVNAAGTLTLKIKFGATTVFTSIGIDITDNVNRARWKLNLLCMNSSASAQKMAFDFRSITSSVSFATAIGGSTLMLFGAGDGSISEDTSSAKTFDMTAEWSVSSASLSIQRNMALTLLMPPT